MNSSGEAETQIVASIRRIMRAVDLHSRHLVETCGLTGPQIAVLQSAAALDPATAGAIARAVRISAATTTGILTRLEKRGLVTRSRGTDDRRTIRVTVTEEGRAALDAAPSLLHDRFREQLAGLADWERAMILSVLQRIAQMMDAEALDAAPLLVTSSGPLAGDPPTSSSTPTRS